MALARRLGTSTPRAYGRFFAYRVAALADFRWQPGLIADDTQLADFVCEHSVPVRIVEEARVLVTPAASSQDFHLQTQKFIAARTRLPGGGRPASTVAAAAITARVTHCGRGLRDSPCGQQRSAETIADLLRRLVGTSGHDEAGDRAYSVKRSGPPSILALARKKFCLASKARRSLSQLA